MALLGGLLGRNTGYFLRSSLLALAPRRRKAGCLAYRCNICGQTCEGFLHEMSRESPSCPRCISTVRMRGIIHVLSMELFGKSLAIPDFPERKDLVGLGLSDWEGYAQPLARKLGYTNTYYHCEPRLDITAIDTRREGTLDFLIATEVFEHVSPPVSVAFANARRLLKPDGVFVFSVPYLDRPAAPTREHFPDLHDYQVQRTAAGYRLLNRTRDGRVQSFDRLVFHGGPGTTLEMRQFTEDSLRDEFRAAGFAKVKTYRENYFPFGIYWHESWGLPMAARP